MRRVKFGVIFLLIGLAIAYGFHLIQLTNAGYCFAQKKYLTEEEKIRIAIPDLLKKYPPSVLLQKHHSNAAVAGYLPPPNPIYYRDIAEFLLLNPECCKFTPPAKFREGNGEFSLTERWFGVATNLIAVNYAVRYVDDSKIKTINTEAYLYITSCGTPGSAPYEP